ncbi:Transposase type 1 [Trinorchestia longiramus]|nr:Transposase type 1 [Trinorchestia longiramus]
MSSGKRNGKRQREDDVSSGASKKGYWALGLLQAAKDPALVEHRDDLMVIIKDKYPKLLPISTEHGEKSPQGIGQYEGGSGNSGVVMRTLKMKRVVDVWVVSRTSNCMRRNVLEQNPRQSAREMSQTLGVSIATVSRHLKVIGKVKKLDKWVPHELNENQKLWHFEVCSMLSLRNTNDPFLDRIVTCDEKWVLYDNHKRSGQWLDRDEPPKHFPKPMLHQKKIMVTVWWSAIGVIHYSFLGVNETINAGRYCNDLAVMHARLSEKRPALVNQCSPILLHDNTRPHVARMTVQKLTELADETLPHPPYSPDLSPTDYHLFKHLSTFLDGKTFRSKQEAHHHYLVLPHLSLSSLKSLTSEHVSLLDHMHAEAKKFTEAKHPRINFRLGYHAIPSMAQVHMHVISDDFDSPCLKTKKHWNSFNTKYFVDSEQVISDLRTDGRVRECPASDGKRLLETPLRCHKCSFQPANVPKLKQHILTHILPNVKLVKLAM